MARQATLPAYRDHDTKRAMVKNVVVTTLLTPSLRHRRRRHRQTVLAVHLRGILGALRLRAPGRFNVTETFMPRARHR